MTAQQNEVRLGKIQDLFAVVQDIRQTILDLPDLPLRTAPETGRIQYDPVVLAVAALFAGNKFHGVIADPPDPVVRFRIDRLILLRPVNDPLGCVQMGHIRPRLRHGKGGTAGVGKKVEGAGVFHGRNTFPQSRPVARLLRKKSQMPEVGGLDREIDSAPADDPLAAGVVRSFAALPIPHAAAGTFPGENGVRLRPFLFGHGGFPEGIEGGTDDPVGTDLLQFPAITGIQLLICGVFFHLEFFAIN